MAHARRMPLGGRGQIFHAVVDHLDRVAALHGQQPRVRGEHRRVIFLAAECASGLGLNHAHFFVGKIEDRSQRFVHVKRALQRAPHGDAVFRAPLRDHAVVFNVEMLLRAGAVFAFDDVRGLRPHLIHIAFFKQEPLEHVVFAPDDRVLALALFNAEHRGQRIVFDAHARRRLRAVCACRDAPAERSASSQWFTRPSARQG